MRQGFTRVLLYHIYEVLCGGEKFPERWGGERKKKGRKCLHLDLFLKEKGEKGEKKKID